MLNYNFIICLIDPINKKYERIFETIPDANDVEFFVWKEVVERAANKCPEGYYINSIRLLGTESL